MICGFSDRRFTINAIVLGVVSMAANTHSTIRSTICSVVNSILPVASFSASSFSMDDNRSSYEWLDDRFFFLSSMMLLI